jgi:uncharacterized peroxidase-related enzyme
VSATADAPAAAEPLSRLRVPAEDEVSPRIRAIFEATRRSLGHVDNWTRAVALGGDHFVRLSAYLGPLIAGPGPLTHREREIIATVVSAENRCSFCHPFHVDALAGVIGDRWLAERIAFDHREVRELSEREHLLADLTIKITHDPRAITDADLDALRPHGLDDEGILEAIQLAALINATNRITIALAVLPDRPATPAP